MTTIYGSWQGSGYQARIYCVYTVSYTADHTQAIYAISFGVEFGASISDSVNGWAVSGDCGSATGSNIAYSIPSGGGSKIFRSGESAQKYGDATVAGSINNVEGVGGGTIVSSFTLDSGPLAPYFTDGVYNADTITSTSARIVGYAATGNGGTLNNIQVQYNTTASATGASTYTKGSYAAPTISGLTPNTTYYARIRVANNTYGYGPWGAWISFNTLSGLPGAPLTTWFFGDIDQSSAGIGGNNVADNGGSALTEWDTEYNTAANSTGSTVLTTSVPFAGAMTGLDAGTTYYARIRAKNVNGAGPWSDWKSFTTLESGWVNIPGVGWRPGAAYICESPGVWKLAERYVAVSDGSGGVNWKQ